MVGWIRRGIGSAERQAEPEAFAARLEARDFIARYAAIDEPHDSGLVEWSETPETETSPGDAGLFDEANEHLCLVPTRDGYELLACPGSAPVAGTVIELGAGLSGEVMKVARSPLPSDKRLCVYLLQAAAMSTEEVVGLALVGGSS